MVQNSITNELIESKISINKMAIFGHYGIMGQPFSISRNI